MPNFDKTGPNGDGAASGNGRGSCGENQSGAFMRRGRGSGAGVGRRGMCFQNNVPSLDEQEKFLEKKLKEVQAAKKDLKSKNA